MGEAASHLFSAGAKPLPGPRDMATPSLPAEGAGLPCDQKWGGKGDPSRGHGGPRDDRLSGLLEVTRPGEHVSRGLNSGVVCRLCVCESGCVCTFVCLCARVCLCCRVYQCLGACVWACVYLCVMWVCTSGSVCLCPGPRVQNQTWNLRDQECVLLSTGGALAPPLWLARSGFRQEIPVERISFHLFVVV